MTEQESVIINRTNNEELCNQLRGLVSDIKVKSLTIRYNTFKSPPVCDALVELLRTNTALTQLDMSGCFMGSKSSKKIIDALMANNTLTDLVLNYIYFNGRGGIGLGLERLISKPNLYSLSLERCHLSNDEFMALLGHLRTNTSLVSIRMGLVNVPEGFSQGMVDVLQVNTTLMEFNTYDASAITILPHAEQILECFKRNRNNWTMKNTPLLSLVWDKV